VTEIISDFHFWRYKVFHQLVHGQLQLMNELEPLDPSYVAETLSRPPFVTIQGVVNVRDLGNLPSTYRPGEITRSNCVFRSAELSSITDEGVYFERHDCLLSYRTEGKARLKGMGITTVFDLRSDIEMLKYNAPIPVIDGVSILRAPIFKEEDYSPETMAK
jgi:hypothetical protein